MPRTTIDLDSTVLKELKRRARRQRTTLSSVTSELLAFALYADRGSSPPELVWRTSPMGARVDLRDKEAVRLALERR